MVASTLAAALLGILAASAPAALAGVEVRAAKMSRGVVVGAVFLAVAAGFAVGEEGLVGGDVDADPDFAYGGVHAVNVPAELVLTVEAFGLVIADVAVGLWSRRAVHRGFGDGGHFLGCAVCRGDADHFVRV